MHSQKLGWLLLSPTIVILGLFGIFPFVGVDRSPLSIPQWDTVLLGKLCFAVKL